MSTLTIELDTLTENRLLARSRQEGRKKEELAAGLLADSLALPIPTGMSEAELLAQINRGWSEAKWERYRALVALRKEERLTEAEYTELCDLTTARETAHVERLYFVLELAKRRNLSFEEAMRQLGIGSRDVE